MIEGNLRALPADCQVILSDQSRSDDSLERLAAGWGGDPRVRFRTAAGPPGWREHCNALLASVTTPLAAILPQDDSISPGFFEALVAVHQSRPETAVSFGVVQATNIEPGGGSVMLERLPYQPGERPAWREAVDAAFHWNPGIAFRGVFRTALAQSIAPTDRDRFADLVWVFGMALHGHLVEVPEVIYLKRMHAAATHPAWERFSEDERRWHLMQEVIRRFPNRPDRVNAIGLELWSEYARRMPPPWREQLQGW